MEPTAQDAETLIGRDVATLSTPALVVDAAGLERNLKRMADWFAGRRSRLRPHFKSHKCVTLAHRQIGAGHTSGITCAKLSEAEALVAGGIEDVLIANQVVGPDKARRLAALNRRATVRAAVDSARNAAELGAAALDAGVTIGVLVEVDIGMGRCGVAPGKAAVDITQTVDNTGGLRFDGLQGYEGHLVALPEPEERRRRTLEAVAVLVETRRSLESAGLAPAIVSGGGTGTYDITGGVDGIDEVQAGSYALMDWHYRRIRPEFECCRCVLATVISARGDRIVADVGTKGLGCEFGPPVVDGVPEAKALRCAEEHTIVENVAASVGDKIRLVPSHGCTTNNLYRRMWLVRDGLIEAMWPIEGAGCVE